MTKRVIPCVDLLFMYFKQHIILGLLGLSVVANLHNNLLAQTKRALLIGVGTYPIENGWTSLSSKNDIELIKSALLERGFAAENITSILDEKATYQGILQGFQAYLTDKANSGDIVYFHYSGHGQQKRDLDGDEIDGYDECLVSYDSPKKFQKGVYEGQRLVTDDDLARCLTSLRNKLGPQGQLIVVLDACHSGTGTRGIGPARGAADIMADPDYVNSRQISTQQIENSSLNMSKSNSANLAPMIAYFGSAQNQLNYEMTTESGEHYGSLSYALAKTFVKTDASTTYRGLFDKIRTEMSTIAPNQTPQSEGDLDLQIANGKLLSKPNYYLATKVISDSELVIKAGEIHGLHLNSEFGIYPPETRNIESEIALATGKITKCLPAESIITLDKPLTTEQIKSSWVILTNNSVGMIKLKIGTKIDIPEIEKSLDHCFFTKPFIEKNQTNPQIWIEYNSVLKSIQLNSSNGYLLKSIFIQSAAQVEANCTNLLNTAKSFLHGDFIRKMELEGTDIKVSFKIIPVDSIQDEKDLDNLKSLQINKGSIKEMSLVTKFRILIINEGLKPAYYTLLDLQPDNIINILIPQEPSTPEEMRIIPDQKILFPTVFKLGVPLGQEMFKLISSDKPIDLRASLATRGIRNPSPFEKLFNETKTDEGLNTRSASSSNLKASEINIYSEIFTITK